MQNDEKKPGQTPSYYGKKLYYVNELLIVKKATVINNQPQFKFEDIENDQDR
jgi:hypothetical protein